MDVRPLIVIPLYNHACRIESVLKGVLAHCQNDKATLAFMPDACHILVVDDGSTDSGGDIAQRVAASPAAADSHIDIITHDKNRGKGAAVLSAASWAKRHGFTHIVTLDADGQHLPEEMHKILAASSKKPKSIVVGERNFQTEHVPGASRFGRSFSGFWMRVQTGVRSPDMQSGFRAYPVALLLSLTCRERRYAFEMEVLVKAAWSGFEILSVPVNVYYPPKNERVSHFGKLRDNARITIMNTKLTVRALIPLPFLQREQSAGKISVLHPLESLRRLLLQKNTPFKLSVSTFAAVLINILPFIGIQSIITLLAIGWLGLNRVWTLAVHHALWPPLVIPACVETGYFVRNGEWLTSLSWATITDEAHLRLLEWLMGSAILGPLAALLAGAMVYGASWLLCRQISISSPPNVI